MIVIDLPRRLLETKVRDLDAHMAMRLPSWSPGVDALRKFLVSAWEDGLAVGAAIDAEWLAELDAIVVDLLALAIKGARRHEARAEPLQRVSRIVSARLEDPGLTGREIALELGVSLRTLQLWLAAIGKTPRAFILEARLARAAERLQSRPTASVTEIALESGFNDSAYFSRCFSRRYGSPPALWRKTS
jgi:AraC-like DNA-binding protein